MRGREVGDILKVRTVKGGRKNFPREGSGNVFVGRYERA